MQRKASFPIKNLQQFMRLARLAAGYSTQTAAAMQIPVSVRALQYYESGQIRPGEGIVEAMARAYRVPDLLDYYFEERGRAA
jgi:transcriptional regulator with XRE-family HTH domain